MAAGGPQVNIDLSNLCPNNCTNNGNCTNTGSCNCALGYKGADCSQREDARAELKSSTQTGIWDLSGGDLNDIVFKTSKFVSSNQNASIRYRVYVKLFITWLYSLIN